MSLDDRACTYIIWTVKLDLGVLALVVMYGLVTVIHTKRIALEVQFQKKPNFYWEFLSEIFLYLNQYQPENDWKAVAIFANRETTPKQISNFQQELVTNHRLILVYLDELEDSESIAIGIIQLITHPEKDAPRIVQNLKQQNLNSDIIELIEAVLVAKFKKLSREEIEEMFALSDLKNTRVYQDALQEGEQKGWQKGLTRGLTRGLQKGWKKGKQEGKQEGRQEGKQEGKQEIAMNLLRVGMSVEQVAQVTGLTVEQVRQLH